MRSPGGTGGGLAAQALKAQINHGNNAGRRNAFNGVAIVFHPGPSCSLSP
jgi:hypothetical protein